VAGALQALRELPEDVELLLVGDSARLEAALAEQGGMPGTRLHVVHAEETIAPGEPAASAVRRKRKSSIVEGLRLQKEHKADAFVSAGSTGAVMAASLFLLGPVPGVDRPAIATPLPTAGDPLLLIDAGANVDTKPQHLIQFARLASIYVEDVWQRPSPRVALLNIGEEPEKGDERAVETYGRLAASDLNFVGNVEGRDVIRGVCDVLVADGFVGNVLLKFYESIMAFMHGLLEREFAQAGVSVDLDRMLRAFDYTEYGGAPLLGVNGVSIICHGGSPPHAIANALRVARQAVQTKMVGHIAREVTAHEGETRAAVPGGSEG
jgi:glycerol-3-phosphate acyltransferase PlsX